MEPQDRRDIETLFAHLEQLIRDIGSLTPPERSPEFLALVRKVAVACDTAHPARPIEWLARALDIISQPTERVEEDVTFDPDDYPLL